MIEFCVCCVLVHVLGPQRPLGDFYLPITTLAVASLFVLAF